MEFHFTNDRPIYLQLVEQLEHYIISGQFSPGEKLPSVRDLAYYTKMNPNTVQKALQELEDRHLIITERTSGKFVTEDHRFLHKRQAELAHLTMRNFLQDMRSLGFTHSDIINHLQKMKGKY